MLSRNLVRLAIGALLIAGGLAPALAQIQPNASAPPPASTLTPTSLAIPRPAASPQTGKTQTSPVHGESSQLAIVPPETSLLAGLPVSARKSARRRPMSPAEAAAKGVLVTTAQHTTWGRVSFALRGNPAPEVRLVPDGIEVHLAPGVHLEVAPSAQLRETGPIGVRDDDGAAVAVVHLTCHCRPEQDRGSGFLHLNIHPDPAPAPQPATPPVTAAKDAPTSRQETAAKAATEGKTPPPASAGPEARMTDGAKAKNDNSDRTATEAKAEAGAKPASDAKPALPEPASRTTTAVRPEVAGKAAPAARSSEAEEMARLRVFLTEKLAKLNATPPQVTPPALPSLRSDAAASRPAGAAMPDRPSGSATGDAVAQAQPEAPGGPPLPCLPRIDASGWRGAGSFAERLVVLRAQEARSQFAVEDVAALAEFYLANGLGHEAMAAATEALTMAASAPARLRLSRDADIGSLIVGETLSPVSPLLANCQRPDTPLWRSLAAATASDAEGAARDPEVVAAALRTLPEPLQRELAFRIVAAVGDNLDALRAMAGAMRNATIELPEDEARRFLLQARIADLTGDRAEYAAFLERAARFDMTPAGVTAKARLAAVRAAEGGPAAAHAEAVLIDIARTYRHDALGQQAAEQYAELRLQRHDYATALAIADESAGPRGPQPRESRGAGLVLRILRMLLVDPASAALPEPNERIALYLRYGGYATPGEKRDDIRLAAARLMLAHRLPDAALDTLRQLSETTAATPEASQMLATAEAFGGDPAKAIDLVKELPDEIAAHRVAAEALRQIRQPLQAAHVLDGAAEIADRERRAGLLFEAEAWPEAASAYAELLRDPLLPATRRNDLATRYALAVAMHGPAENVTVLKLPDAPARLLAAVPSAAAGANPGQPGLRSLRGALERARRIETLLDPPTAHQGS